MAFSHGKEATLSIDGTAITAYTDNVSFSRDVDNQEVTVFGNDDKTYIAGLRGATISCSGPADPTGIAVLNGCFDGGTVAFAYSPDGGTTTYSGNALISNFTPSTSVSGRAEWSATLTITGSVSVA